MSLVQVSGPGSFGGTTVTITPFFRIWSNLFSSQAGTGSSVPITINFSTPVSQVTITCHGSNVDGNKMVALGALGETLGEADFAFQPNAWITDFSDTKTINISGISAVKLIPAGGDFIAFNNLTIDTAASTTPPTQLPLDQTLEYSLTIRAIAAPVPQTLGFVVLEDVKPAVPIFPPAAFTSSVLLFVNPIQVPYEQIIEQIAQSLTQPIITNFFDEDRVLKTVLNFGGDFQALLTNWKRDVSNPQPDRILVKLYQPLPQSISVKDLVWISRELSPSLLDQVSVIITPDRQIILFLRPPNQNVSVLGQSGIEINNATLTSLLPSGSLVSTQTNAVLQDPVLQEFFTTELAGVDLNVDYTDYNNFVHFSSAANRLEAFQQKLTTLEATNTALGAQIAAASASSAYSGLTNISGSPNFVFIQTLLQQKQDLIRSFDGYEQFLYYDSGSFSGSVSGDPDDPIIFIANVAWPKDVNGNVVSVTSSQGLAFIESQGNIAAEYDVGNGEALRANLPQFVQFDSASNSFSTFLDMIGHHFDIVKLYIDNFTNLYDRSPDPSKGLSKELLWHVGQSLGIELPNQYAIKQLLNFTVGSGSATQQTYQDVITETWKRFIHNQIWLAKSKGTRMALQGLLNTYGVPQETIRIREGLTPGALTTSGSFEQFQELIHVLDFVSGSHLTIPFSSSGYVPSTIEVRLSTQQTTSGTFLSSTSGWSLVAVPTGSSDKGTIQLRDGTGNTVLQSAVGHFFSGDYFTVMLRQNSLTSYDLTIKQFSQEVFDYSYGPAPIVTGSFTGSWNAQSLILGDPAAPFSGTIDEFRIWLEVTTDDTFNNHVRFPGMYAGNTDTSALNSLLWRHSFVIPQNLGATASLANDSPFIVTHTGSVPLSASVATGFPSITTFPYNFALVSRESTRFVLNSGGNQFATDTIRIAAPATFDSSSVLFAPLVTSSWTPANLASKTSWFAWYEVPKETGSVNNANVPLLHDWGTFGFHITQSSVPSQPLYQSGRLGYFNNQPFVQFRNGLATYLESIGSVPSASYGATVYIVAAIRDLGALNTGSLNLGLFARQNYNHLITNYHASQSGAPVPEHTIYNGIGLIGEPVTTQPVLIEAVFQSGSNSTASLLQINEHAPTQGNTGTGSNFNGSTGPSGYIIVGAEIDGFNSSNSDIAAVLYVSGVLDNATRAQARAYFEGKYGIATGSVIPILSRTRSIRSFVEKQDDRQTIPRIGFYLTLADSINDSILRSVGNVDLGQLIGDPRDLQSSVYPDLLNEYTFYRRNYSPVFDYNKFISFAQDLLDGLFQQAKTLSPARANLLTGVVIEPTILERNRVPLNKPIKMDGANTRREKNAAAILLASGSYPDARNVDMNILDSGSINKISGQTLQLMAQVIDVGPTEQINAVTEMMDAFIAQSSSFQMTAKELTTQALIATTGTTAVSAFITPLQVAIQVPAASASLTMTVPMSDFNVNVGNLIFTRLNGELFAGGFLMPMVNPASSLSDPASTTFFVHPSGSFGVQAFTLVPTRSGTLRSRGNWVQGTVYTVDDIVTQLGATGSFPQASVGEGVQFRCITPAVLDPLGNRGPFVSYLPPSLDRANWVQVAFIQQSTLLVQKAIVSGSTVAIVPFTTPGTPFIGYAKTHYIFFRDTTTRHIRARYVGCLQTENTTFDGLPPIQVTPSAGAQLFVTQGTPVQPPNDQSGPILNVK